MEARLSDLLTNALKNGLQPNQLRDVTKVKKNVKPRYLKEQTSYKYYFYVTALIVLLIAVGLPRKAFRSPVTYMYRSFYEMVYDPEGSCLVNTGQMTFDIIRPIINCDMCKGMNNKVPVVQNMSKEYFLRHHAYTGVPVLIKGGAKHWSALKTYSYQYFKKLYGTKEILEEFEESQCLFFGYKTNFRTLKNVFQMSKKRSELKKDQWYIGWSNCIEHVQNKLRQHYSRPEFLPDDSESSSLDWIFMGGSGTGAMMHLDAVNRPSWQAMIKGKKTWYIEPPPECEFQCSKHLSATMEPGDILVIDTNKWYHSTYIFPGEMAITIGSEYD